jgi:voltage-gated potassium channel Kch
MSGRLSAIVLASALLPSSAMLLASPGTVRAEPPDTTAPPAAAPDVLIGQWSSKTASPSGQEITTDVEFKADMSFEGRASVGGKVFFEFRGTWSHTDQTLVWHYAETTPPIPEASRTVADSILSSDPKSLVLLSKQSGQQRSFEKLAAP